MMGTGNRNRETGKGGIAVKSEVTVADPALKKMMEGLLALCGISALSPVPGEDEDCLLRITDAPDTARSFRGDGRRSACVLLVPRGTVAGNGEFFPLPVPVSLPEAAAVLAEAARSLGERQSVSRSETDVRGSSFAGPEGDPPSDGRGSEEIGERFPAGTAPDLPAYADPSVGLESGGAALVSEDFRTVARDGKTVRLTAREAGYFRILTERRGETVSREELLAARLPLSREEPERTDETQSAREKESNLTDVYIGYLRKKLRPIFGDGAILSVRGKGYTLRPLCEIRIQSIIP